MLRSREARQAHIISTAMSRYPALSFPRYGAYSLARPTPASTETRWSCRSTFRKSSCVRAVSSRLTCAEDFRDEGEATMPKAAATTHTIEARISRDDEARCQEILALWMAVLNRYDAPAMYALMCFPHVR